VGEQVGTIGSDLQVEDDIGWKEIGDGAADGSVWRKDEEALVAFAQTELLRAAHHAVAIDAAEFADLDFEIARKDGTGKGERDFVTGAVVLCAADDLENLAVAGIDGANAEAVGVGVL